MTRILASLAAVALLAGPAIAFAQGDAAPAPMAAAPMMTIAPAGDLVDTLRASGQFTLLLKALDASNLTSVLKSAGPLTVLAPTDAAFNALPAGQLDNLLKVENASQLQALLLIHIINAAVTPDKIKGSIPVSIPNVANSKDQFDATTATIRVDDATVVGIGTASNGDIYAIDKVLNPAWTAPPAAAPAAPPAQ
jgi:uncharacterized surface protein with fasciclin (FAS1) repeats